MPAAQKSYKRRKRGPNYPLYALILIIVVALGVLVYAVSQSPSTPTVKGTLNTSMGTIQIELYQSKAPRTVANFVNLANSGFYNNLVWHRIANTPTPFVIQTGDPTTRDGGGNRSKWGEGGSSQTIPLEIDSSLRNYLGYIAMARVGNDLNSGTSQFYINLKDNTNLDGSYTVFGKVTAGIDVVNRIANSPVEGQTPLDPLPFLTSVTIANP